MFKKLKMPWRSSQNMIVLETGEAAFLRIVGSEVTSDTCCKSLVVRFSCYSFSFTSFCKLWEGLVGSGTKSSSKAEQQFRGECLTWSVWATPS